jgi:hypothetical protein
MFSTMRLSNGAIKPIYQNFLGSIINVGVRENNLQNRNKKSRAYF